MFKSLVCVFALVLCVACGREEVASSGDFGGAGSTVAESAHPSQFADQNFSEMESDWIWIKRGLGGSVATAPSSGRKVTRTSSHFDALIESHN